MLGRVGGARPVTVDLDSSIFEVYGYLKEGARYGYSRVRGLHPLLAFVHDERLLIGARLRAGHRASADGVERFRPQVVQAIPEGRTVRLRMDAGFYAQGVEHLCVARHLGFSISAKLTNRAGRDERAARERLATLPLGGGCRVGGVPLSAPRLVA